MPRFLSIKDIERFKLAETKVGSATNINLPLKVRQNYKIRPGTVLEWYAAHRDIMLPEDQLDVVVLVVVRRAD